MAYRDVVMADSPSLYWRLGELTAVIPAEDETANNRDGTYTGTVVTNQTGALFGDANTAVDLDGTTGRVISAYNPFTNATIRTFEGWTWRDTSTTADTIFGGTAASNEPLMNIASGAQTVQFSASGIANVVAVGTWPGNTQWGHWVLVFDESANTVECYINGVSQGVVAHTTAYNATPGNFQIGIRQTTTGAFDGKFDEVAVYTGALSAARVLAHYDAGIGRQRIDLTELATAEAFGSPTLARGSVSVAPTAIGSAEALGSPTLARGAVTVAPTAIASVEAFGSPTLARGAVNVLPTEIGTLEAFGSPTLTPGSVSVLPAAIASGEAFDSPTLLRGAVTILPTDIGSAEAFGTPALQLVIAPLSIGSEEFIGVPGVVPIGYLLPDAIPSAEAFGSPTLIPGMVAIILTDGIPSGEALGLPNLVRAGRGRVYAVVAVAPGISAELEVAATHATIEPEPALTGEIDDE